MGIQPFHAKRWNTVFLKVEGKQQGVYGVRSFSFKPSAMLRNLRNSRRQSVDNYSHEEGAIFPHQKTPSTTTSQLEIHGTVGMLMQSFIGEDAAGHAAHAWP